MTAVTSDTSSNPVVLERFRRDLGDLWTEVAPLLRSAEDPAELAAALHAQNRAVSHALPDLEALLAGWAHYDSTRRAILSGAVTYVTDSTPPRPARTPAEGGTRDDIVVDAAIRAILRQG